MTLSHNHQALVSLTSEWCEKNDDPNRHIIMIDAYSDGFNHLPPGILGHRPDLVWIKSNGKFRFIGEAKTRNDLNNRHTRRQLSSFLKVLEGQDEGELIVAVPFGLEGTARALISTLQRQLGQKTRRWVVISNAPNNSMQDG